MRRLGEVKSRWMIWARLGSCAAATIAVGLPAATSCAKEGPLRDAARIARDGGDDLGHAEEGVLLDAFAGADDDLFAREQGANVGDDVAQMLRWRDAEEYVGLEDGAWKVGGDEDVRGQREAGKVGEIFAGVVELLGQWHGVGPEDEVVASATSQGEGESGAPGARSEDADTAHAAAFFAPKRLSVPASRRRMLAWCLTMISSGMKRKPAMTIGVR